MELPNKQPGAEPPKKNIQPVISDAVPLSRPATRRFLDFMFAESAKSVMSRIGKDVVVPRIKMGIEEAARNFISGMFWGNGANPMSGMNVVQGTVLRGGNNIYTNIQQQPSLLAQAATANQPIKSGAYQDLVMPTQEHAEMVLGAMLELYNRYRVVAVADLYELVDRKPEPSDEKYGWHTLDSARISKNREGYVLELPRPTLI